MSDEAAGIPERLFAKPCHPERPNENCSWSVSKEPSEGSVEYRRVDPPAAPAKDGFPCYCRCHVQVTIRQDSCVHCNSYLAYPTPSVPAEERDKALAQEAVRIVNYCQQVDLPFSQRQGYVEDALATVRAEERSACIEAVRSLRHKSELDDSRWNAALYHAETKLESLTIQEQEKQL